MSSQTSFLTVTGSFAFYLSRSRLIRLIFLCFVDVLTVPPDIVDSESSGDVMVSESANTTLRCTATGHPQPVITWRREDGKPIHNHGNNQNKPLVCLN